jgi:hypothetical protein
MAYATDGWTFDLYSDYGCGTESGSYSQSANIGQGCATLSASFPSASQIGGSVSGCVPYVYTTTDCSDEGGGCETLGTCCSSNDESTVWVAYSVDCS